MIPVEIFAAKDAGGTVQGVMLAVPLGCGLQRADTLRIHGAKLIALEKRSMLPIDLPELDVTAHKDLLAAASSGEGLVVGEFTALGLAKSYVLALEMIAESNGNLNADGRRR